MGRYTETIYTFGFLIDKEEKEDTKNNLSDKEDEDEDKECILTNKENRETKEEKKEEDKVIDEEGENILTKVLNLFPSLEWRSVNLEDDNDKWPYYLIYDPLYAVETHIKGYVMGTIIGKGMKPAEEMIETSLKKREDFIRFTKEFEIDPKWYMVIVEEC